MDFKTLEKAIEQLEPYSNVPALYSGNTRLVNQDLQFIKNETSNPETTLGSAIVKNYATGCTVVFNRKLMTELKRYRPREIPFHDWWANLVCLSLGGVSIYDTTPHMSYRQHGNNVVGVQKVAFNKRFINKIKGRNSYHKDFADELLKLFSCDMSCINEKSMQALNYYHNCNTLVGKIELLTSSYFKKNYFRNKFQFGFKLLMFE